MSKQLLCIVPARSGSKGVPNKNVRPLLGEPLMVHTIHAAIAAMKSLDSEVSYQIAVSSDSDTYLEIATNLGVSAIRRPVEIAMDSTPMVEVIRHTLNHYATRGSCPYKTVILLQPTCPARQPWHINEALILYCERSAKSLVSVVKMEDTHPARMYTKDNEDLGHSLQPLDATRNRQELLPVYHRNGAIYIFDSSLVDQNRLMSETPLLYEMEKKYSINIDDEVDWIFAEAMCAFLQNH